MLPGSRAYPSRKPSVSQPANCQMSRPRPQTAGQIRPDSRRELCTKLGDIASDLEEVLIELVIAPWQTTYGCLR